LSFGPCPKAGARSARDNARGAGRPAALHNGLPELTPYGRLFKRNGYTLKGGTPNLSPVAAMVIPTFTHIDVGIAKVASFLAAQ